MIKSIYAKSVKCSPIYKLPEVKRIKISKKFAIGLKIIHKSTKANKNMMINKVTMSISDVAEIYRRSTRLKSCNTGIKQAVSFYSMQVSNEKKKGLYRNNGNINKKRIM